tara:strand:- start:123 stop:491 length:369 start_codon:yes stop_codon:yes gene_type:complete
VDSQPIRDTPRPRPFCQERTSNHLYKNDKGECALVKVGATVVGRIRVCYHDLVSNKSGAKNQQVVLEFPFHVNRGEELGLFELGSTVICLFPPGQIELGELQVEQKICLGQAVGRFCLDSKD